jgi:uncharacterized protein (TIGR03435 family)
MKLLCALLGMGLALQAQTPAFEVASVKPNKSGGGGSSIRSTTGQISMENVSLKKLTLWSYGIPDDREYALVGPAWLTTEHFDILAKFPAGTDVAQVRRMAQTMLAERFKLALHSETRQLPAYVLVVAKNGPKIHAVEDGQSNTSGRPGHLEATRTSLRKLCDLFARMIGAPVTDATGLPGVFTFTLDWTPDETQRLAPPDENATPNPSGMSIFTAVQEQLGLKLEGRKGPVEVLVVDRMERVPTGN